MEIGTVLLIIAALLPAVVLCVYTFSKDRVEKEPLGLLLKLFLFGALCCFPAAILEDILIGMIDGFFGVETDVYGNTVFPSNAVYYMHTLVKYVVGVALVEEGLKWLSLNIITKNNNEFDCLFDGLIYAIFVSLGFAALENVLYVHQYGWINAIMRAVLSVPGHMFFAVMMGYHYSNRHITDKAREAEQHLKSLGLIPVGMAEFDSRKSNRLSLAIPVAIHGAYNFCCSVSTSWAIFAFIVLIVFLYVHCFKKIKVVSKADAYNQNYVAILMLKKYPCLEEQIREIFL